MLKLEVISALAVLTCGQILWWRRRDNVLGYLSAGLFLASVVIPVLGTSVLDSADPRVVELYARILLIGAAAYLLGLGYGGHLGNRARAPRVTFVEPLDDVPRDLARRARWVSIAAVLALLAAFALLGYVPLLAGDRRLAKYGVGPYAAGFQRGSQVFHLAMRLASIAAAVLLAFLFVRRRTIELVLLAALLIGLTCTLSRGEALTGPLTFVLAYGVQRRWRPWALLLVASLSFLGATVVNEVLFATGDAPVASASFAQRVAGSAPDISDHLGFLHGFELLGSERIGMKTLRAGYSLSIQKGYYDPADYALRTRTGLSNTSELASGGLRLPAPIWGYVSYGYDGVLAWSFFSGLFTGWGTTLLRRFLTEVEDGQHKNQALNLILAWVFYSGTFGILGNFFFPFRSNILIVVLALALGLKSASLKPQEARSRLVAH